MFKAARQTAQQLDKWPWVLYNLGLMVLLFVGWPFLLLWLLLVPKTRAGFWQKWGYYPKAVQQPLQQLHEHRAQHPGQTGIVWFHAVSVGEINALWPLVTWVLQAGGLAVVSVTTKTGHGLAQSFIEGYNKKYPEAMPPVLLYFPYDLPQPVSNALMAVKPDLMVIAETEWWPNLIHQAAHWFNVPVMLVNGRISDKSFRGYQRFKWLFGPVLRQFAGCYMQTPADAERVIQLGADASRVSVSGNLKFEGVGMLDGEQLIRLSKQLGLEPPPGYLDGEASPMPKKPAVQVLTAASTHTGEDAWILSAYLSLRQLFPTLKLILAPRHPERGDAVERLLQEACRQGEGQGKPLQMIRRSRMAADECAPPETDIVLLDSIGELKTVYALSTVALIGGSLIRRGGQNPLEAIAVGVPVVMGANMQNFRAIARLVVDAGAGVQLSSAETLPNPVPALVATVQALLTETTRYQMMSEAGVELIREHQGALNVLAGAIAQHVALPQGSQLAYGERVPGHGEPVVAGVPGAAGMSFQQHLSAAMEEDAK